MAEKFTQEVYDSALSQIGEGRVFTFGGRSARTEEDIAFIAKAEGFKSNAAKTDEEKPKTTGAKKASEKKEEESTKAPEVPPVVPVVDADAETKKQEAEKLVEDKLAALNAAKTDEEKEKATKEYEDAQKALLDLG